ncbi:helix-turn-helix domain-containing protein [Wenyingzhuangia sp. IMCC45533]
MRKLRKNNGISIKEIAFKAEVNTQNLRKYELGKQEMRIRMLKRVATAFDISTSELLSFDIFKKK